MRLGAPVSKCVDGSGREIGLAAELAIKEILYVQPQDNRTQLSLALMLSDAPTWPSWLLAQSTIAAWQQAGHRLSLVYLYGPAVAALTQKDLLAPWRGSLAVCQAACERRQLLAVAEAACGIEIIGLPAWGECQRSADRCVMLGHLREASS